MAGLAPLLRPYTPAVSSRRWIITLVVVLAAAVVAGSYAFYVTRDNSKAKALEYARQACKDYNMDGAANDSSAPDRAATQAGIWQTSADNAARAARLDPAWNELARAADTQARAWALAAKQDPTLSDQLAASLQEIGQHPVDPECRKATVS